MSSPTASRLAARPWRAICAWNATAAVVFASVLVYSARWSWLGELAASLQWHVGWLSLVAATVVWALGARRSAVLAGLLGAAHLWPEAKLWLPRGDTHGAAGSLRIASANLLQPNRHRAEIAAALAGTGADVIAVLELSRTMRAELEQELRDWPYRAFSPPGPREWSDSTWALGVFSKRPLENVRLVHLRECYAPAIEADVACGSGQILLRVVHLPRPGEEWRVHARNEALEELVEVCAWSDRCVLAGDLNTTSSSPAFDRLLERSGLRDSRAGFGRQPSWWLRSLGVPLSITIDHVLVGKRVQVRSRGTFELPWSDHAGVVSELELR